MKHDLRNQKADRNAIRETLENSRSVSGSGSDIRGWILDRRLRRYVAQGGEKPALKTRNVLLVTIDGLRWQEVFGGAEPALIDKEAGGVKNPAEIRERYLRNSVVEQRTVLMPFFWNTIAQQALSSAIRIRNRRRS